MIRLESRQAVAELILDKAPNNAVDQELLRELAVQLESLASQPDLRVLLLRSGLERHFSVGADLGAMAQVDRQSSQAMEQIVNMTVQMQLTYLALERFPRPVIAAIKGNCLGAGCELALCCDYRIMVDDQRATIGQPEVHLGVMPGLGGTQRLPRLVGRSKAAQMLFEGRRLTAPEALAIGLIDGCAPAEDFEAVVADLVARLVKMPPIALAEIKACLAEAGSDGLRAGLAREARGFARCALTQDAVIGVAAFFAKRSPEFIGR